MQIENPGINSISTTKTENLHQLSNASSVQSKYNEASNQKDVASLSEEGKLLSKAYAAFGEIDNSIREELVSNIKQQVDNGTYTIPVDKLATALMKNNRI